MSPYKDPEQKKIYNREWQRKKSKAKYNTLLKNYPPIKILPNMKETSYPGYYVTEEGDVYREPANKGERMPIDENGLVYLKPGRRGHTKYPEKQYDCINISITLENGKRKQFTKSNHQLVAETFVDNPHNYTEILHLDENPRNNHYSNLKWGTHKENLQVKAYPEGTIVEHARKKSSNRNPTRYIKKDGKWVLIPSNRPPWNKGKKYKMPEGHQAWNKGKRWKKSKQLPEGTVKTRKNGAKYKKIDGKWVYQGREKMEGEPRYKVDRVHKSKPDGTITTRADGTKWKKENGKWVYQKKK